MLRKVAHLLQASHEALLQFLQALLLVHPPVTPLQPSSVPDYSSFVGLVPCWRLLPEKREEIMQRMGEMDVSKKTAEEHAGNVTRECRIQHQCKSDTQSGGDGQEARGITKHAMMLDCSKISCLDRCCVVNLRWPCSALGPRASGSCPWDLEKAFVKHGTQIWAEGPVWGGAGICRVGGVGVWGCRPHSCRWVRIHFTT